MNSPAFGTDRRGASVDDPAATRLLGLIDLRDALRISGQVLSSDPDQLAGQLIGRLAPVRSLGVARVLDGAKNHRGAPWFQPLTPSLVTVGGPLRMTLAGHSGWVGGVAISADGWAAVSGSDDSTLRVWDLEHGDCRRIISGHVGPVRGVGISTDGRIGVSGGDDGTVRVWNLEEGRELYRLEGHAGPVRAVALAADGQIAVSGGDDGLIRVWEVASCRQLHALSGHEGRVRGVAISDDGHVAVSCGDDATVAVWDLQLFKRRTSTFAARPWCVAADVVGSTVAWGLHDGTLAVWRPQCDSTPTRWTGHGGLVRAAAVTPDGATIVSGSDDRTVRVWRRAGEGAQVLGEHAAAVGCVAVGATGRVAVSGAGDGVLMVWDLDRVDPPQLPVEPMQQAPDYGVCGLEVTGDGRFAVSRGVDGTIKTWDVDRWTEVAVLRDRRDLATANTRVLALLRGGAVDVAFDPERRIQVLRVWDLESGDVVGRLEGSDVRINALAASSDGRYVFAGMHDGRLAIFDLVDSTRTIAKARHRSGILDVAVSPDGRWILTATAHGLVGVWDIDEIDRLPHMMGGAGPGATAVVSMLDSRHAVAGYAEGVVVLWDLVAGSEVARRRLHETTVTSLLALPDGKTVVSTSQDGTVRAWWPTRLGRPSPAFTGQTAMLCAAATPDGAAILAGERSGRIHPLRLVDPGAL